MVKTLTPEQIAEKKADLVEVAMAILEQDGLQALTLRRLASDAGISRTTPYLYFEDKCDLIQAVCAETFRYLTRECCAAMEACDDNLDKIVAMGKCYLKFGIERPALYQLSFAPENPGDKVTDEVLAVVEEYKRITDQPMEIAYKEGILKYPPDRLNPVLWACFHGLLCLRWAGHLAEEEMFDRVQQDLAQILGLGFIDEDRYVALYGPRD